jgi:hypothetical protein
MLGGVRLEHRAALLKWQVEEGVEEGVKKWLSGSSSSSSCGSFPAHAVFIGIGYRRTILEAEFG